MANATGKNSYPGVLGWVVGREEWLDSEASRVRRYWRAIEEGGTAGNTHWVGQTMTGLWTDRAGTNDRPNTLIRGQEMTRFKGGTGEKFAPFFSSGEDPGSERASRAALWYFFGGGTRNMDLLHPTQQFREGGTRTRKGRPGARRKRESKGNPESASSKKSFLGYLASKAPAEKIPFVRGVVKQAIVPGHYYSKAMANWGGPAGVTQREMVELRKGIQSMMGTSTPSNIMTTGARDRIRKAVAMESGTTPKKGDLRGESRSLDSGNGIVVVTANVRTQDNVRTGRGHFSHSYWQAMIIDVNRQMAIAFQKEVVAAMDKDRRRPPTGDMRNATESAQNRFPQ
jgi:hypothetical protein